MTFGSPNLNNNDHKNYLKFDNDSISLNTSDLERIHIDGHPI